MEENKYIKISELCKKVCSGGTPKSSVTSYYDGNIPWLNTKEINFNRIYSTERNITEEGLNNSSAKWIEKNAVVVAMYGATAGKSAISKIPLTTNQACCNLMINPEKADYRFVYYALASDYNRLASLANGGAQQNLNAQQIKDFEIPKFTLEEQKRIADFLSSLDDKIELNRQINDNLEQQAQALFKSWFVDFEPFKDGEFIESELGMIPKGWKVGELGEIAEFKRGKTITQKDTVLGCIPVIAGGLEPAYYHNKANTSAPIVTISASGANAGYTQILFEDVWASDCSFIDSTCDYLLFAYCFLSINSRILRHAQVGAAQPHVYAKDVNAFALPIPNDTNIIKQFILQIEPMFEMIGNLRSEIKELAQLRDTLLPRLMSGELKINEINC